MQAIHDGTLAATTHRIVPPEFDPRTRRYGYNPGVRHLEVHQRLTGRQSILIPAGCLIPFRTFPDMRTENWSTDKDDTSSLETTADLLAADQIANVLIYGEAMGFRELEALRALSDEKSERIFNRLHPEITCPVPENENLCVTCRLADLESIPETGEAATDETLSTLLASARVCKRYFESEWRGLLGEMEKRKRGEAGIASLSEGHLYIMRQLHETLPEQKQMEIQSQNALAQIEATRVAMREQAEMLAAAVREGRDNGEVLELRRQIEAQQTQFDELKKLIESQVPAPKQEETTTRRKKSEADT